MTRIAERAYLPGDALPVVGSKCLVAGSNADITSDQDRAYGERLVLGYSPDRQFICLQTEGCWPTVERLTNCWFGPIEAAPSAIAPPIECGPEHIGDEISGVIDDLAEVARDLSDEGHSHRALDRARASLNALLPYTHHLPVPATSAKAASSAIAPSPGFTFAWVIERADSSPAAPLYFEFMCELYKPTGDTLKGWAWNRDNAKAARFARKEDADLCWRAVTTRGMDEVRIAEHGWDTRGSLAALSAAPSAIAPGEWVGKLTALPRYDGNGGARLGESVIVQCDNGRYVELEAVLALIPEKGEG